jgi:enhancing lycopene biosynthesis protein 2
MKKIGVVLSGCGVYDGSEIHEAVITLLAIARSGAQAICYAPDKVQTDVINHLTGEAQAESRNVLVEAARIARGEIQPLAGPSGCAGCADRARRFWRGKEPQQLCFAGSECEVDRDLKALALAMHQAGKPLGFICIAPALLPKIFAIPLRVTIGTDLDTADAVEEMGAEHVPCPVDDIVVDEDIRW